MEHAEPFPDNWTYLRIELNWLDRLLSTAVARQRKEVKEIDRVARSRADQVSSHWWKGLLQLDGETGGDSSTDTPQRRSSPAKNTYQQQMEARIRASQQRSIALGLPSLCQRLQLTPFEKNLVLMALAPEVSRRYGRIYSYLQDTEHPSNSGGLPTVDLVLRLLCRNDAEWRNARLLLTAQSDLIRYQLVRLPSSSAEPFLAHPVKLVDALVEYLLADQPHPDSLTALLRDCPDNCLDETPRGFGFQTQSLRNLEPWTPDSTPVPTTKSTLHLLSTHSVRDAEDNSDPWTTLVLPEPLLASCQHLCARLRHGDTVAQQWRFQTVNPVQPLTMGTVTLWIGAAGTGKKTAAHAIARATSLPLHSIDLGQLSPHDSLLLLREVSSEAPYILLIQSTEQWFGRRTSLAPERLRQFLQERQRQPGITILVVERKSQVSPRWQQYMSPILEFPIPASSSRSRLWQQAFPTQVPLADDIDWRSLAQLTLSGGDIQAIAQDAAICALAESPNTKLAMRHLIQACTLRNLKLTAKRG